MTSSSIKPVFYSTRSATDLIFTAIPKIEAPLGRDNRAVASSFLAPTYETGLINSPTLGSFSFSLFCRLLPLTAPVLFELRRRRNRAPCPRRPWPLHHPEPSREPRRTPASVSSFLLVGQICVKLLLFFPCSSPSFASSW